MAGEGSSEIMAKVQAFCTENDECTGYYCDKEVNWCIATNKVPAECTGKIRVMMAMMCTSTTTRRR
jgi:hypothetical protein